MSDLQVMPILLITDYSLFQIEIAKNYGGLPLYLALV